jgi:hypothetical protein
MHEFILEWSQAGFDLLQLSQELFALGLRL